MSALTRLLGSLSQPMRHPARALGHALAAVGLSLVTPLKTWSQDPAPLPPRDIPAMPALDDVLGTITPSFSTAPRSMFVRRGPRGAKGYDSRSSVWLSTNVHDLLPSPAAKVWPSPVRLSVGRRFSDGPVGSEYAIGLDLDAARLPGTNPKWMAVKQLLHTVRLPGPALVMSPTGQRFVGLYW
jgi:hypothetical protein